MLANKVVFSINRCDTPNLDVHNNTICIGSQNQVNGSLHQFSHITLGKLKQGHTNSHICKQIVIV